jgi:uncharacterized phiE125 gp8 family phage protein
LYGYNTYPENRLHYERGYGLDYSLRLVTGPATEPLTLADEIIHSRINLGSPADTDEQTYIESLFVAARRAVEDAIFKPIGVQEFEFGLPCFPWGFALEMPKPPLVAITSINYTKQDGMVVPLHDVNLSPALISTIFTVEAGSTPGKLFLKWDQGWPSDSLANGYPVKIRFTAGIDATLPENANVMQLLRFAFAHYYDNREPVTDGRVNQPFDVPNTFDYLVGKAQHWEMR